MPPEVEWFANSSNPNTRRAYEAAVKDFMRLAGIGRPEEFRSVTRAHLIAWRDELRRHGLGGATSWLLRVAWGRTLRFISFAVNYPRPSPVRRGAIPLGGAGLFLVEEAEWQRHRELLALAFTDPASTFWLRISTPRQEHQVGRFLGVSEERLARSAN